MYAAVPLGATLSAIVSGWTGQLQRRPGDDAGQPGRLRLPDVDWLDRHFVPTLLLLVVFGYLVAIASCAVHAGAGPHAGQLSGPGQQPVDGAGRDRQLIGTLGIGLLGKLLSSLGSIFFCGAYAAGVGLLLVASACCARRRCTTPAWPLGPTRPRAARIVAKLGRPTGDNRGQTLGSDPGVASAGARQEG